MSGSEKEVEAKIAQAVKEAREDELYQTLKILKKLGVIDEHAMNRMALEGYWAQGEALRRVTEEQASPFGFTVRQRNFILSIGLGLVIGMLLITILFRGEG